MIVEKQFKNILIYSGGETVGDGLYKISFLYNLRRAFPKSHITWMAGKGPTEYSRSLKPLIVSLIDAVKEDYPIAKNPFLDLIFSYPLKNKYYDLIIDTQTVVIPTLILKRIKHGVFISSTANWLFSDIKFKDKNKSISLNERLNLFIALVTNTKLSKNLNYVNLKGLYELKYDKLAEKLLPKNKNYIGISPGAGDKEKIWPLENFIEIALELKNKGRTPVFFLGPSEKDLLKYIKKRIPNALFPEWEDIAIKSGLKGPILVIALAHKLKLGIANDSGTGHMFAAGGCPLISIFSKHSPLKYAPLARKLTIIDSKKWGTKDPHIIPTEEVKKAIENLLKK